jgi:phosphopentomutase
MTTPCRPRPGMLLDQARPKAACRCCAIGKIYDIYLGRGILERRRTRDNNGRMAWPRSLRAAERVAPAA